MRQIAILIAIPLLLSACGGGSQNNSSQGLEEAAEVSDPAVAQVLENAAENGTDPQNALQQAGNAQATTVPGGATTNTAGAAGNDLAGQNAGGNAQ